MSKRSISVMASGPSAKGRVISSPMIVVNKDLERYPDAEYFITCDLSFARYAKHILCSYRNISVFAFDLTEIRLKMCDLMPFKFIINCNGSSQKDYFSKSFNDFNTGMNSGFSAVQFAIIMGYTEIHMYGVDLKLDKDQSHWHGGYGHSKQEVEERLNIYFEKFKSAIEKSEGIRFISHSKESRLNELKKVEVS